VAPSESGLFERSYAPLTCGLLAPFSPDKKLAAKKRSQPTASMRASLTISANSYGR